VKSLSLTHLTGDSGSSVFMTVRLGQCCTMGLDCQSQSDTWTITF
jgi:hypothetical protein